MLDQGELFTIPNPCRGVCTSNNKGYCKGCLRSRKERFHWNDFTPFQQQLVINLCEKRRLKILAGPGEEVTEEETDISQLDLFLADTLSEKIAQENAHKAQKAAEVTASEKRKTRRQYRSYNQWQNHLQSLARLPHTLVKTISSTCSDTFSSSRVLRK